MSWGGGWGNHTPDTARTVAKAFYAGRACKRGNCRTDGENYWLENACIARRIKSEDVLTRLTAALVHGHSARMLEFSYGGWPTKMTARHLCALGVDADVYGIKNPDCRLNNRPCGSDVWYTPEEIAELKPVPPKFIKPRAVYVPSPQLSLGFDLAY